MSSIFLANATGFYQRHENKLVIIVVVLLSIYLLAFAAKLTWRFIPETKLQVTNQSSTPNKINSQSSNTGTPDISQVLRLNLFGDTKSAIAPAEVEPVDDVPETKLNLVLSGVVASNKSNLGAAVIEYQNQQSSYSIGDKVEGTNVTLDEIYTDRVIIKNRVTRETLMLEGIDFDEANQNRNKQTSSKQSAQAPQQNKVLENRPDPKLLQEARAKIAESPASFTEIISLSPHTVNNELIGYKVSPGSNSTLFYSVGLKNGDIVVNLNGFDLSDLPQSLEALNEIQEADSLQLEVLRKGDYVSLDFDIQSNTEDE